MRKIISIAIIAASAFLLSCLRDRKGKEIKIGIIGPMKFLQGRGHWNGAQLAQEEINKAGGYQVGNKKRKIKLIKADSNEFLSMTDATNAMERLLSRDKVDIIMGGFRSEAVLAMQELAVEAKKLFIVVGAADHSLTDKVGKNYDKYKYFFRAAPFNNKNLGRVAFIQLGFVAGILKKRLRIPRLKVALIGEKALWVDGMIRASKAVIPKMGMELVGIYRPSQTATNVTAELADIQRKGAHILFTVFSSSVGITFARQAGEMKIPAVQVGINVEAQKARFWDATRKYGDYVMTMNTYGRTVEQNELTRGFIENYIWMFGEVPAYTADTYAVIAIILKSAIEKTGSIDPLDLILAMEKQTYKVPAGTLKFNKNHDVTWGPGFVVGLGTQWQNGKLVGVWPNGWKMSKDSTEVTYKGMLPYKIPPWMIERYR